MKTKLTKGLTIVCLVAVLFAAVLAYPLFSSDIRVADGKDFGKQSFENLWYYGDGALEIGAAKAVVDGWDKSKLSPKVIAVIDTGIDAAHEIFEGVLYTDKDGKAVGYNSRTGRTELATNLADRSEDRHGTSISGVIAMLIKEFDLQDYIKIYPIKANSVNNKGEEQNSIAVEAVVNGINQAVKVGADAINMSFGRVKSDNGAVWAEDSDDKSLVNAIYAAADSTFMVAAAGNNGKDSAIDDNVFNPAGISSVYSVMSYGVKVTDGTYNKNALAANSNYGNAYDIAAPGCDVYTAFNSVGNTYHLMPGSSLATPMATFAGVLLKLRYEAEERTPLSGAYVTAYMRNLKDLRTVKRDNYDIKCLDLKTVVTQDFDNTVFNYVAPTEISVVHNGKYGSGDYKETIVMHASNVQTLEFNVKLSPSGQIDPDLYDSVEWILRKEVGKNEDDEPIYSETHLGYGAKLNYAPNIFGKTKVVAVLRGTGKPLEYAQDLYIEYAPYLVGEVRVTYAANVNDDVSVAPSSGVLYTTETTVFGLTGIQLVDKSVTIKWYVDDVLMGEGETFAYTPTKSGKQRISAQYGDNPKVNTSFVFVADVRPFIARPLDLSMLIIGLAVVVVATSIIITVAVKKKRKARNEEN